MYNVSSSLKFKICFLETYLKSQKMINDNILNTTLLSIIWKLNRKSFNMNFKNISALSIYNAYVVNSENRNGTNSIVQKLELLEVQIFTAMSQQNHSTHKKKSKRQEQELLFSYFLDSTE